MASCQRFDVAIVGAGIAGLTVALSLPPDWRVALFTKGRLGESNTRYAQGGLAAALGPDDSPELHYADTLAAGAGLCDPEAVRVLVEEAPAAVRWLIELGVRFDRAVPGESTEATTADGLLLGQEAAHCRRRILHAGGDATGAEIERALLAALKARSQITIYADTPVCALLVDEAGCSGLQALDRQGQPFVVEARHTVLACGGTGSLWAYTSNPAGATADGLALAWRAGAALADLEFVQFHPTVLKVNGATHLISEAVRGEGAYLRNHAGERFMPRYHPLAELAPRDVVARAILSEMLTEGVDCQYLDLTHLPDERMYARFPTIASLCRRHGLDLAHDLLPVAPAAHYCMGGIQVDLQGRSSIPHLYAVGEVACTGVHGANRLASNSLLEGLVFGRRLAALLPGEAPEQASGASGRRQRELRLSLFSAQDQAYPWPLPPAWVGPEELARALQRELRDLMWRSVSLCRDEDGLRSAWQTLQRLQARFVEAARPRAPHEPVGRGWLETANMLDSAALVVQAALARRESRGSHWRSDYPQPDPSLSGVSLVLRPALESVEVTSRPALQHKGRPYV
ncbi:L-aspartate oxidase [Thermogemmatispora aurantia]|uniref:L-aspartate oxidase n=1 Tax=Thermogemmatispora aurantia TaxID=2045279 RepID=A0A5J4K4V9_9CHLR|nr:L-aspartate oxidase [Thermogemmatispora aurantia]GER83684.1 L-aspartate oxidase [Thermogemmatispora aurantia]